jgi:hypothetical protein
MVEARATVKSPQNLSAGAPLANADFVLIFPFDSKH